MTRVSAIWKRYPGLGFALAAVGVVSLVFPFLFAYIDQHSSWQVLRAEFWLTPLRMLILTLLVYSVIRLGNRYAGVHQNHWLRHVLQWLIILPAMYGVLYAVYAYLQLPIACGQCQPHTDTWEYRRYIGLYFVGTIALYGCLSAINFYNQAIQKTAEAERLQREYAQSRLQALKSQVNPHFLFNSLSVLSELVQQDAELSEKFIHHLSKAYRYILEQKDSQLVTVEEELAFLDAYFFLLQIRFGKKIQLQKNVNPACMACQVPPLTLQLLVENAVKHNKMSGLEPLIIYLTINEQQLEVRNAIRRRDEAASGTGIGIENIKRRVAHATDKPVLIEDDGKTFTITIPLMPPTFKVPERV